MAEYINKRELIDNLRKFAPEHYSELIHMLIRNQPTADVVEVKHGKWTDAYISGVHHYRCTNCGEYIEAIWTANFDYNYCPNCGARMNGGNV